MDFDSLLTVLIIGIAVWLFVTEKLPIDVVGAGVLSALVLLRLVTPQKGLEGFASAATLMKPGDHWLVFIPSKLGYGARGAPGAIPPNADLLFEILMVGVE